MFLLPGLSRLFGVLQQWLSSLEKIDVVFEKHVTLVYYAIKVICYLLASVLRGALCCGSAVV